MAKWQKVITSGSSPELAHVTASGGFNSPGTASFGDITGTVSTATQAKVDHDSLLNFVADEHIAHGGVSVVAGTGLTGGGTIAANRTLNVIGGDGITANANDIAITAAQTTITSIFATDLKIGEDAQTAIDFETANEIHLDANNAQVVNVRAGGIEVTGDVTASAGIHAAAVISGSGFTTPLGTVTAFSGAFSSVSASGTTFATIGTATQAVIDHDSLANFVANEHIDHSGVSVVAGTGLTGGGTIAANRTLNVIGGDGITANANDIAITAAQTTITSIFATDLKIGEDAQTAIDFETANEIHLDANNAEVVNVRAGGIEVTGDVTASAGIHAAAVISGSGFLTPLGTVTAFSGAFSSVSASGTTFATIGTATQGVIDHDSLANFVANEHIDHSGVSVVAGTGLTGGGTIAANRTLNVIGGDGITANANDIAITAAQTTITSIFATDLKIGEDAQTAIDFETANEIHLDANNAEVVNVRAGGIEVTGDVTASAGIHAAAVISGSGFTTPLGTVTALSGAFGDVSASGTILAAKLDALAVSDALAAAIVAEIDNNEIPIAKLAQDAVTVTAGTGLTGAGAVTLGTAVTMNVIGGDGITANANDIAITAAQTTIESIFKTDLKIGEDAQTAIDFETANEIHLDANNAQVVNVRAGGIEVTGDVTASAGIHAAAVISGSGFLTPLGTVTALSGAFGDVSASGTILAAKLDALAVSDALAAAIVAEIDNNEIPIAKLAQDAVTVTAGTGLTGAGAVTLGTAVTMNVIGGDGITANANDIAITAAQTTIESIFKTDLKIGEDAQTAIDFETANEIHLDANNAQVVNVRAGGIEVTGQITASSGISASHFQTSFAPASAVKEGTGSFGHVTASFAGDGSGLINVTADATGLTQGRIFIGNDANVATAVAVSGDATIAENGVVTLGTVGANHVTEISNLTAGEGAQLENINSVTISNTQWGYLGALDQAVQTDSNVSFNNLNVNGNLVVAGTASFEETANLNVKDRFISLASGSTAGGDGGIVVNQALGNVPSGSAFGYEAGTADRWAVQANFVPTGSAMVPDAYMGIVTFTTSAPSGNPQYGGANYGYGNIHVDTDDGEIYIFA